MAALVAVGGLGLVAHATAQRTTPKAVAASPASITAKSKTTGHFLYVVPDREIDVYDIDHGHRFVQKIKLPQVKTARGVAMSPRTGRIYVSYGGQGGDSGNGSVVAYDLLRNRVVWQKDYDTGVDSIAITPNGKTIYMPVGEDSGKGIWEILDASTGEITGSIEAGAGAHNTIVSLDGKYVYLGGVDYPYLAVASTATNKVVKEIGPLRTGGRPFTFNRAQTIAFTTAHDYLGLQVDSITTGKVLYTIPVPGFTWDPASFTRQPTHGISLSPNERQIYLIDTPNGYVHVFDVSRVPGSPPRDIKDIKLPHPVPDDGGVGAWLLNSRDGRYLYVERSGDVIDTRTFKTVAYLELMRYTASSIEIDWRRGRPVFTTTRHGLGYVR